MRRLRRVLFSTGPKIGLTVGCGGLLLIGLVIAQDRPIEDQALGYFVAFVGFSWAAITGYLKPWSTYFVSGSSFGCGIVLAAVASIHLELANATLALSYAVFACVYLASLLIEMVIGFRRERKRAEELLRELDRLTR